MRMSFARHHFPPAIIRPAVWLYARFTLSYRDVEDLLAERGLDISYGTGQRWVLKFGPLFTREPAQRRGKGARTNFRFRHRKLTPRAIPNQTSAYRWSRTLRRLSGYRTNRRFKRY
jgi:hypothetical protein